MSRRDFLKLSRLLPMSLAGPGLVRQLSRPAGAGSGRQNVMIVVFDAFSAYHVDFHGYARETTPNLNRLLDRAIVYHNHHAAADFTSPGTASLLTGTLPWTHRVFALDGPVTPGMLRQNIFGAFGDYHRITYSHNPAANSLLKQFWRDLDEYVPQNELFLASNPLTYSLFGNDEDIANVAWARTMSQANQGYSYSPFLSEIYGPAMDRLLAGQRQRFPLGLPRLTTEEPFLLEDAIDWLKQEVGRLPQPYVGYFHFLPPHNPYAPRADVHRTFFGDGYRAPLKPLDIFATDPPSEQDNTMLRRHYDEFILYADREFGRLFEHLDATGALENTWVVLTSDHGEMFERGVQFHITPLLYEPVIRVPLVIFEPGRKARTDIHSLTSAVDVLPTLLHVTGHAPAAWAEGQVLAPFAEPSSTRAVYAMHTHKNQATEAVEHATVTLLKDEYKLLYFFGYEETLGKGVERIELYDVKADPEELHDLYSERRGIADELLASLKRRLAEVNAAYL